MAIHLYVQRKSKRNMIMVNGHKRYWNPISQWGLFVNIQSIISLYYAMTYLLLACLLLLLNQQYAILKCTQSLILPLCILLFAFEACTVNAEWNNYEQLSQTQQQKTNEALAMMMILLLYIYTCTYFFYVVVAAFSFVKANHVSQSMLECARNSACLSLYFNISK